ncbi:hypothetical protein C8R32_102153 [Nitrosospira sp. Nsp5]|nr:hypothetical protein C8R32_102153 [Nitrosospira sp. Nsp5]
MHSKAGVDRAILSTLLYHGLRPEELTKLEVKDYCHTRRGVAYYGYKTARCTLFPPIQE